MAPLAALDVRVREAKDALTKATEADTAKSDVDTKKAVVAAKAALKLAKQSDIVNRRAQLADAEKAEVKDAKLIEELKKEINEVLYPEASMMDKYQDTPLKRGGAVVTVGGATYLLIAAYHQMTKEENDQENVFAKAGKTMITPVTKTMEWYGLGENNTNKKSLPKAIAATMAFTIGADFIANYIINGSIKGGYLSSMAYNKIRGN